MNERDHQIRERAYLLWERAGRPHGDGDDFWHQAALEIAREAVAPPANGIDPAPVPAKAAKAKSRSKVKAKAEDAPAPIEAPKPDIKQEAKAEKSAGKKKKKQKD
jgi:hypothetical protein